MDISIDIKKLTEGIFGASIVLWIIGVILSMTRLRDFAYHTFIAIPFIFILFCVFGPSLTSLLKKAGVNIV